MQLLNSKAFYLKNYSLKGRAKTEAKQVRIHPRSQLGKIDDIMRIRNITNNNMTLQPFMPKIKVTKQSVQLEIQAKNSSKMQSIYQKQQDLLLKIYKSKRGELKSRRSHSVSLNEDFLVEKHPIAQINPLQFEIMKPTNRYFQKIQNIRLAEKLILAKPSRDINRTSQQKFYQQQATYKMNISKLSYRDGDGKKKKLHCRKWID